LQASCAYSSLIQLPTDAPPQLMPIPRLCAKLSRRFLSMGLPFIVIGLAPFSNLDVSDDSGTASDCLEPSIARGRADEAPLSVFPFNAAVKSESWLPRGDVEVCRIVLVKLSSGVGPAAIERSRGVAPNSGKVFSSKSGPTSDESTQRLVVDLAVCGGR